MMIDPLMPCTMNPVTSGKGDSSLSRIALS